MNARRPDRATHRLVEMMIHVFSAESADDIWRRLADTLRDSQVDCVRTSRAGSTIDIGQVVIELTKPRNRWTVSRRPSLNPAFAIAEVVWIATGRNDAAFVNYFNRALPRYAGTGSTYDGAYGYRLRRHQGIDQLDRAYHALRNCGHTRQVVLQIWDSRVDLPALDGMPCSPDIPCNIVSFLKVHDGHLEWTQVMRSNDAFRGLPHNLVQFTALQEVMAGWLDLDLGSFNLITDSMHLYENDLPVLAYDASTVNVVSSDSLCLAKDESDQVFADLAFAIEQISGGSLTDQQLQLLPAVIALPHAFANFLIILVSESLRRRGKTHEASDLMLTCSNQVLHQLWHNWLKRMDTNVSRLQ